MMEHEVRTQGVSHDSGKSGFQTHKRADPEDPPTPRGSSMVLKEGSTTTTTKRTDRLEERGVVLWCVCFRVKEGIPGLL